MSARTIIAWLGFVVLMVLHLDFWRPQRVELYWGWLPEELGYRVLWMLGAWLYLLYVCGWVWRDDGADPGNGPHDRPPGNQ